MGLLDTFSKKFGFTTEEDDENEMEIDEEEIDDEEDEEEEAEESTFSFHFPSNPFRRASRATSASSRRREAAQEDEEEEDAPRVPRQKKTVRSNIIHDPRMMNQSAEPAYKHCERIVSVRQIEECREIIKCLLRGESVLLNLENADPKDCGRVVDLLSGAAFALQGRMIKVAHLSYLLAPDSVEVIEGEIYQNPQVRYR